MAVGALLEVFSIAATVLTTDALHTTRDTTTTVVDQHGADYPITTRRVAADRNS